MADYGTIKVNKVTYKNGSDSDTDFDFKTDIVSLNSPTFTGTPAAPTAAADTNTTQVATTAYVQTELGDYATLASPTLTGTPTVPGYAPLAGADFTGDVTIELDDYLVLGGGGVTGFLLGRSTGADSSIYGEIRQGRDEDLYIQGAAGKKVAITSFTDSVYAYDSEIMAEFIDQGAVKLYYDQGTYADAKFETKSDGVKVTGEIEVIGQVDCDTVDIRNGQITSDSYGHLTLNDDVVANWGYHSDGRIAYLSSNNSFNIRCPGGTADLVIGTGAATKFTNEDGLTEYGRFDSDGGLVLKKRAVGEIEPLSTTSNSTAVDFSDASNFSLTLDENSTLAQPTEQLAGQSGSIFITQDTGGGFTLGYHDDWKWAGGTAPDLSTAEASVDRIDYIIAASNQIHAVLTLAVA